MSAFVHRLRVRYHECDAQGHVFNAHFVAYIDVALTELWREAFGAYDRMVDEHGVDVVVGEVAVRFLAPVRFDDELDVGLTITRLGTTGMTTDVVMRRGAQTCATGTIRHVYVAAGSAAKAPVPDAVRAALAPWTEAPAAAPAEAAS